MFDRPLASLPNLSDLSDLPDLFGSQDFLLILVLIFLALRIATSVLKFVRKPAEVGSLELEALKVEKDAIAKQLVSQEAETKILKQECIDLHQQLDLQKEQLWSAYRSDTFAKIQPLLTQYQSVRQMAIAKPDLPAKNLVALFANLDNLLQAWEFEPIGEVWQQTSYDPQLHEPDQADIEAGEVVYVRFVGYRSASGDRILAPAKVSRTLPAIAINAAKS
jgi:molecular chaperone GrpE (heat shock protein)